jgi:prolyl-tRNA synthetase
MSEELGIKAGKTDFGKWYLEVIDKCGILDKRYPVKGFPIYMPWGMFIIRQIAAALEKELERNGHRPVNFPVIIPESSLKKEKEHVKGFENEVFWITHAGNNELDERLFLRPTSETAFYPMYSLWIRSYTDLPLKLYQTVQVYRYETKMTKPLMRGREFFWIEAHTAQKSNEAAINQVKEDMRIFENVLSELGIPFLLFERPSWDRFPGAESSYAYEIIIPDGNTLQIGTTHNLGQRFSKPFEISFTDEKGKKNLVYQTCFGPGISRIAAAIISLHGDDKGLVLPPDIAPLQAVIVPILLKGKEKDVMKKAAEVNKKLCAFRTLLDERNYRPGFKFNEWEMKGVPIRIEIGPKDIEKKQITLVRRDGKKISVDEKELEKAVRSELDDMTKSLRSSAKKYSESNIKEAGSFNELEKMIQKGGFFRVNFCSVDTGGEACAERIEKELGAEVRGVLFNKKEKPAGKCVVCGKAASCVVYIAKAY